MISVNSVFKYVDIENGERIRVIEVDENCAYVINLDATTSMPRKENKNKLQEELEANKLILIKNPFVRIIEDKDLSLVQISKRDEDWGFCTEVLGKV